ncbi:MAG: hypothetical protein O2780_03840 [Proteobacteria bacterium]|jgi:hypothetical protein|nr:hypothetical protein [Pseudomonadota bacterium]MDA1298982.1 hypothetical protein [Pseudomonadota bacterium]
MSRQFPFEPTNHALDQPMEQGVQLRLMRHRNWMESWPAGFACSVNTVENEQTQVNVQIQGTAEMLHQHDDAGAQPLARARPRGG